MAFIYTSSRQSRGAKIVSEHTEQAKLVKWFDWQYPSYSKLLIALVNSQILVSQLPKTNKFKVLNYLKSEGLKPGVPDLFLAVPSRGKSGMFIEMKDLTRGVLSIAQIQYIEKLTASGYEAICCHGFDAARAAIDVYLQRQCA